MATRIGSFLLRPRLQVPLVLSSLSRPAMQNASYTPQWRQLSVIARKKKPMSTVTRVALAVVGVSFVGISAAVGYQLGRPIQTEDYTIPALDGVPARPDWTKYDANLEERSDESTLAGYYRRAQIRIKQLIAHFSEPSSTKLLPDPLPAPYQQPYTLILDLDDTLIHAEWTALNGWRIAKRPGVDYFLGYLSNFYEIVIFSEQPPMYADSIINNLDPHHFVVYRLFRDGTKYIDGVHVKDLNFINRDLSKVIIMDNNALSFRLQPENGILVPSWNGDFDDTYLVNMIPFLETIAMLQTEDVRPVLKQYQGLDIPKEFAANQRRYEEAKAKAMSQQQQKPKGLSGLFRPPLPTPAAEMDITQQQAWQHQQFLLQQQQLAQQQEQPQTQQNPQTPTQTTSGGRDVKTK